MLMSWQNREKSEQKQWWQCSQGVASAVHCVLILKFAVFQQKVITKSRPAASFKSTTTNTAVETVAGWPLDKNNLPLHFPQDLTRLPSLFKKFLYFEKVWVGWVAGGLWWWVTTGDWMVKWEYRRTREYEQSSDLFCARNTPSPCDTVTLFQP